MCHFKDFILQNKVIYHQIMTPSWMTAHASYIDSHHSKTTEQLTFNAGPTDHAALLKVPTIPGGVLKHAVPLTVKIVVSNDVSIRTTHDSDIAYGVSDGINFVGFVMTDKGNYGNNAPCYRCDGISGTSLIGRRASGRSPKPSDSFYLGRVLITLKLDEHWGSCYTAHDGGFTKTAVYNNRLMPIKGITLEVYKQGKHEKVGIKFIEVTTIL